LFYICITVTVSHNSNLKVLALLNECRSETLHDFSKAFLIYTTMETINGMKGYLNYMNKLEESKIKHILIRNNEEDRYFRLKEFLIEFSKVLNINLIYAVNDHKGCLEIYWYFEPNKDQKAIVLNLWELFNECNVEHFFINK